MSYSATHCWFGWPGCVPTNGDKPLVGVFREIVQKNWGKTIKSENMEHNSPVQLAIKIGYPPRSRPTLVGCAEYICIHPLLWNPWDYEWQSTTPDLFVSWTTIIHCGKGVYKPLLWICAKGLKKSFLVDSPNSGTENRNNFSQSTKLMRGPILIAAIRRGWILQTHQQSGWKCGCSKLPKPSWMFKIMTRDSCYNLLQ